MSGVSRQLSTGALHLLALALLLVASCSGGEPQPTRPSESVDRGPEPLISATGKVLPRRWADLGFEMGGTLRHVGVGVGDVVAADQLLATLGAADLEAALAEAEAALAVAQSQADLARAGVREPVVARAREALDLAREGLREAELEARAVCAQVEGAEAGVEVAKALLRQAAAGPTANQRELARLRVEQAKAELYGLQGRRDALGGLRGGSVYEVGSFEAAEGQVFAAEISVDMARLEEQILAGGARAEDVSVARAQVAQAEAAVQAAGAQCERVRQSVASAQQRVELSEADLAVAQLGASAEELAVVDAQLRQAEATVGGARVALSKAELRAPLAGTVAELDLRVGEWVAPGESHVTLGDLTELYVETTDLDEIDVARVAVGAPARVTFDALPGVQVAGVVEQIAPKAGAALGGTAFKVTVALDEQRQDLRWGMTVFVDIEVE